MGELFYKTGGNVVPFNSGGASAPMPAVVSWDADSYASSASSVSWGPVDYEDGDLLVMCVMHRAALTTPTGWTLHDTANIPYASTGQWTSILSRRMTGSGAASGTVVQASAQRLIVDVYVVRGAGAVIERPDLLEETEAKRGEFSFTVDGKGATQNLVIWALSSPYWTTPSTTAWSGEIDPAQFGPPMASAQRLTVSSDNLRLGVFFDYAAPGERIFTSTADEADDWVALVALEIPGIPA